MAKINWKVRIKNKTWLLAFLGAILTFAYQILGMLGIVSPLSEDMAAQILGVIVNLFVALGIVQDPTTEGISDSKQALHYYGPATHCKSCGHEYNR